MLCPTHTFNYQGIILRMDLHFHDRASIKVNIRNVKTRAFSILLGLGLSSVCSAQVKLPPITIQSQPSEHTGNSSLSMRAQKEILGTLKQPDTEPKYLGTHWSDRFSQVSLFDM